MSASPKDRPDTHEVARMATVSLEEMIIGTPPPIDDPTETYHEASRLYPGVVDPLVGGPPLLERDDVRASVARSVKRYRGAARRELPVSSLGGASLADVLATRRSTRRFSGGSIGLTELAALLQAAYGVTGALEGGEQMLRTAPSGGALYPLDLYFLAGGVEGLDEALYHYDPLRHELAKLRQVDYGLEVADMTPYPEVLANSTATVVMTAAFWRSRFKYGPRAYRFALLEAGHVAQNLLLAGTALGLGMVPLGGFYDRRADGIVDADGIHEASLYVIPIGTTC